MAAIDIGSAAIDRVSSRAGGYTTIALDNPANDTGTIDYVEFFPQGTSTTGIKVGTFYGSGGTFTNRDYESLGDTSGHTLHTYSGLSIDVETDDYIGFYASPGAGVEATAVGADIYRIYGDYFGQGEVAGYTLEDYDISVYGTGETVAGWTGKIMGVTSPAKVMGVAAANIAKVMGVA